MGCYSYRIYIYNYIYIHTNYTILSNKKLFCFCVFRICPIFLSEKKKRPPFRCRKKVPAFDATKKFYQRVGSLEDRENCVFFFRENGERGGGFFFFSEVKHT